MSAKISAARRAAFLKALSETGNLTLSAERARVSRGWALAHRKRDAEFDAECKAALGKARDTLRAGEERKPPRGWGHLDGEELVVKGTRGGASGRRVQIARARLNQISPRVEDRFVATLAATCNVKAAYTEAGVSKRAIYAHRTRWPAFARRWDEAVEEGFVRLEFGLLEAGLNLFSTRGLSPEEGRAKAEETLHLIHMHKHKTLGLGGRPGGWGLPPIEEVNERLLRKVETIKRARRLSEQDKARDRREWTRRRSSGGRGSGQASQ